MPLIVRLPAFICTRSANGFGYFRPFHPLEEGSLSAPVIETLRAAAAAGVRVSVDRGRLIMEAATEPPTALVDALVRRKAEIIALLDPAARVESGTPGAWVEALTKLSRQRRPPDDISYRQWDQLRGDFTHFCERWAGSAEALGWRPRDLLGWDPRYPYTPIAARLGLAWKIVEVRRDAIVIERRHGFRATLPRHWTM
jgi:hypothetical protein